MTLYVAATIRESEILHGLRNDDEQLPALGQPLTREDRDARGEQRFVTLGMSATGALLVVVFTHREPDIYRLISSWKANKPQRNAYEKSRR